MEVVVYADVLFALNFLMDLVMVFLTALVVKARISMGRVTLAAGILALYGTLIVIPTLQLWFSLAGRIAVSAISVWLFSPKGKRVKAAIVFWMISASLGGGIFALSMMLHLGETLRAVMVNGSFYLDVKFGILVIGIGLTYGLIWGFCRLSVRNFSRERVLIPFCLTINGREVCFTALMDTGCELTVPGTGDAMLLLSEKVLGDFKPKETFTVPIATAGGKRSVLAFYPKRLVCLSKKYQIQGIPAIGITEAVFARDGLYTAVCNPEMICMKNGGEQHEKGKICRGGFLAKDCRAAGYSQTGSGALHRRRRDTAATAWEGGGNGFAHAVKQSGESACCAADPD